MIGLGHDAEVIQKETHFLSRSIQAEFSIYYGGIVILCKFCYSGPSSAFWVKFVVWSDKCQINLITTCFVMIA